MELLSPAGNYDAFIGAINAGADAVYLGGNSYGARAYADNFSDEDILRAIDYAHLFGKKVYLTVNTLVKEKEFDAVCKFVRPFYEQGLDAVIVQDIGLIKRFTEIFPLMEVHASTQCFITGVESALFFKSLGCNRVVLARELSLKEIIDIKAKTGLEVETFIHGSMCYSYSGDCLFSSTLGGRSGNRGRCAGPCRLPYSILDARSNINTSFDYYLSMKDQCTVKLLPSLIDAGIDSFKIEGRMKKPEYSAYVTSVYRRYIDSYLENPVSFAVKDKDFNDLKHIYLRSDIQDGYYNRRKGREMISIKSPSYSGNDENLLENVRNEFLNKSLKLPMDAYVTVEVNKPMELTLSCNDVFVTSKGAVCEPFKSSAITDDSVKKSIGKIKDTAFELSDISISNDNKSFVAVSMINDLRRDAVNKLTEELLLKFRRKSFPGSSEYADSIFIPNGDVKTYISCFSYDQLKACMDYNLKNAVFICSCNVLDDERSKSLKLLKDFSVYYEAPHVLREVNYSKLDKYISSEIISGVYVHNLESLIYLINKGYSKKIIAGPEIYAFNRYSKDIIEKLCDNFVLPYELSSHEIDDVIDENGILSVYGRVPLMVSENCVQNTAFKCAKDFNAGFTYITDRKKNNLPVYLSCKYCYNVIYNAIKTSLLGAVNDGKTKSSAYLISFTDEDFDTAKEVLRAYDDSINHKSNAPLAGEYTKSYYAKGVE